MQNVVAYFRVSTARQASSGLGLEAQQQAVTKFVGAQQLRLVAAFTETESGKRCDRPELLQAFEACRIFGARLVIAKLDRLSRDAYFLLGLEKAGVDFVAADMPHANRLTVGIMALVADEERRMISARTRAALQAAKARGVQLGGNRGVVISSDARKAGLVAIQMRADERARELRGILTALRNIGVTSLNAVARELTQRGVPPPRGGALWQGIQVRRLLDRQAGMLPREVEQHEHTGVDSLARSQIRMDASLTNAR